MGRLSVRGSYAISHERVERITAQRDALLAACKHLAAVSICVKDIGDGSPGWFVDDATRRIVCAAIAKVEVPDDG